MALELRLFSFAPTTGLLQAVTDEFAQLVGLSAEGLIGRHVSEVVTPREVTGTDPGMNGFDAEGSSIACHVHPADDEALAMQLIARPDQREGLWQVTAPDAEGLLALVLQRRELKARLAVMLDSSLVTTWHYDYSRDLFTWDAQASSVLELPGDGLPTKAATLLDWVPTGHRARLEATLEQIRESGSGECELVIRHPRYERYLVLRGRLWDRGADGLPRRAVGIVEDASAERALEKQLMRIAAADPVTSVGNRRAFDRALREEWQRSQRTGSPVSLILLIVDQYGKFAAQMGSTIANHALVAVARMLAGNMSDELLYRFDGGMFALLVRDVDTDGAGQLMCTLLEQLPAIQIPQAPGHSFTATAGCASWPDPQVELTAADLLRRAERALYRAQADGGSRGCTFDGVLDGLEAAVPLTQP